MAGNFVQAAPALPTCTHIHPGAAGPCGRVLKGYMEGRAQGVVSLHGGGWSESLKMREIVMGVALQPEDVIACKVACELAEEELSGSATVLMNMRRAGGE